MKNLKFDLKKTTGKARLGVLHTAHGKINTPAFMPVGTAGTIKAMTPDAVANTGAEIILGNTYHLMLRPGPNLIEKFGGLHKFMNWKGPILTDSGGFQILSLSSLRKLSEKGVVFQSHIDGSSHELTPESSIEIQYKLGADITMVLDECTPFPSNIEKTRTSMERSMRWAIRSKDAFIPREGHGLFGIVQGGMYPELRFESAESLKDIGFDGYAIGGLAVGEGQDMMLKIVDNITQELPSDRPRYLMGVGKPKDLIGAVLRGVDMFDCVLPTRSGRTGQAFSRKGEINMRNSRHKNDTRAIDPACNCYACENFSRCYIHHLIRSKEILGSTLLTWHNLHYYQELMHSLRKAIASESIEAFETEYLTQLDGGDFPALKDK